MSLGYLNVSWGIVAVPARRGGAGNFTPGPMSDQGPIILKVEKKMEKNVFSFLFFQIKKLKKYFQKFLSSETGPLNFQKSRIF